MVRCNNCVKPKKSYSAMEYLRHRVITLRHGCLCNDRQVKWTIARIAEALGLTPRSVILILRRWREQNFALPERRQH